jgi:hypothetical protein
MPMTTHGLAEVGLADWPAWYRALNPGYFVDQGRVNQTRIGKARGRGCVHGVGAGGCCSARENGKRLRTPGRGRVGGGQGQRVPRSGDELGEQIVARLKGMEREREKVNENTKERMAAESEGKNSANATIERAAARDAKDWEDEDSEVSEGEYEKEIVNLSRGKLVDV